MSFDINLEVIVIILTFCLGVAAHAFVNPLRGRRGRRGQLPRRVVDRLRQQAYRYFLKCDHFNYNFNIHLPLKYKMLSYLS